MWLWIIVFFLFKMLQQGLQLNLTLLVLTNASERAQMFNFCLELRLMNACAIHMYLHNIIIRQKIFAIVLITPVLYKI
jgi:hypothetical protein